MKFQCPSTYTSLTLMRRSWISTKRTCLANFSIHHQLMNQKEESPFPNLYSKPSLRAATTFIMAFQVTEPTFLFILKRLAVWMYLCLSTWTYKELGLGIGQAGLRPDLLWPGLTYLVDRPRLRLFRKLV